MNSLKITQAFKTVFSIDTLVNRAYFFVTVPFITTLLIYILQLLPTNAVAVFLTIILVLVLNVIYQLYLWSIAFFYSQQISESDWQEYDLFLGELFSDFGIKLKLLLIRIFWNLPLLVIGFLLILSGGLTGKVSGATISYDTWQLVMLFALALLGIVAEVVFVNISNFIYSETGSFFRAINPISVFRLLFSAAWDYTVILGAALLPVPIALLASLPLVFVLAIPIVGGLIFGLLVGIYTMYTTLFIPNLQGQVWAKLSKRM